MGQIGDRVNLLRLERVPVFGLAVGVCVFLISQHSTWRESPDSELAHKHAELRRAQEALAAERQQLFVDEQFLRQLEEQKQRVRGLAGELYSQRAQLKYSFDTDELVRWLARETAELHVQVGSTKIGQQSLVDRDYASLPLSLTLRGTYSQVMALLSRIDQSPGTLRVQQLSARPIGSSSRNLVMLEWKLDLTAYRLTR